MVYCRWKANFCNIAHSTEGCISAAFNYRGSVMFFFIFFASALLILPAAASLPDVIAKAPQQLEPVDVLFFQAFLLVPCAEKVAELRSVLSESLSKKTISKNLNYAEYSDKPLFQKAIAMGFERYLRMNTMGLSKSTKPPPGTRALKYYTDYFLNYTSNVTVQEPNPQKAFQMARYVMEDYLLTSQVLQAVGQPSQDLVNQAKITITTSYRNIKFEPTGNGRSSKYAKEVLPVPFQLSSPKLSTIPLPSPDLSLGIFSDLLPKDQTFSKIEKYFAEYWGKYVGERASLVEEMIIKEELPKFKEGLLSLVGSQSNFAVMSASNLALAKAYNITGYLPFPNYRNSYELYLNSVLQARMLQSSPELQQANLDNLKLSVKKSINATQVFLDALPLTPSSALIGIQSCYLRMLQKVTISNTFLYSDYNYWKTALKTESFPWELLPNAHPRNSEAKAIIDCYTIQSSIGAMIKENTAIPPLEELPLPSVNIFSKRYYNLSQLYLQSAQACQAQCPQFSPFLCRADMQSHNWEASLLNPQPLTLMELLLFEITIAQVMHYKKSPCLAPRIAYIEEFVRYLQFYKSINAQNMEYAFRQIHFLKSS